MLEDLLGSGQAEAGREALKFNRLREQLHKPACPGGTKTRAEKQVELRQLLSAMQHLGLTHRTLTTQPL